MPDLDKNYLAGLYLDEITLDVMPQEYIDAALEVKLRYDACAPRAGYVCVQDRRVRGGFYYRKAPQGQGVNALPPSKLERALARSQEPPKSEMGFLSKAAIGAGLAVGGLALTGAMVNAGRSSEPYQEPVRQRPTPPPSNTARNVAVGVGAAATVGLGVGTAITNKLTPPANTDIKEVEPDVVVNPKTSASTEVQKTQAPEEVASTEREQGRKEQEARNEAIKQTVEVAIPRTISAYENTLAVKYSRQGGLKEGKEKAAQYKPEGDENFVRLSSLQYSIEKREPTKASIAKTSEDLQKIYDKLKEYGLEDSIEFRKARSQARGKEGQELTSTSSNPYTVKINGVSENVGEVRFTRSQKDIQDAIVEKIKNPQAQSQLSEKPAKPTKPEVVTKAPDLAKIPSAQEGDRPKRTLVDDLSAKLSRNISEDGFVAQSGLISELKKKPQYKNSDLDQEVEDLAKNSDGRIQLVTDKYGKTLVRDLDQVKTSKLVAEAKKLTDPEGDRKKLLDDALDYKIRKATSDDERVGVDELKAAIAGIQEASPTTFRTSKAPKKNKGEDKENGSKQAKTKAIPLEEGFSRIANAKRLSQILTPDLEEATINFRKAPQELQDKTFRKLSTIISRIENKADPTDKELRQLALARQVGFLLGYDKLKDVGSKVKADQEPESSKKKASTIDDLNKKIGEMELQERELTSEVRRRESDPSEKTEVVAPLREQLNSLKESLRGVKQEKSAYIFNSSTKDLKTRSGDKVKDVLDYFDSTRLSGDEFEAVKESWNRSTEVKEARDRLSKNIEIVRSAKDGAISPKELAAIRRDIYRTRYTLQEKEQDLAFGDDPSRFQKVVLSILPEQVNNRSIDLANNILIDEKAFSQNIDSKFIRGTLADVIAITGGSPSTLKKIIKDKPRASADPEKGYINIGVPFEQAKMRTILFHEFGHHLEFESGAILSEARDFIFRRSLAVAPQPRSQVEGIPYKDDSEYLYPDHFITEYVGKSYRKEQKATEVISVGLQHFASPRSLLRLMANDREHFLLMMKVLQ